MSTTLYRFTKTQIGLIALYIFVNGLFILKYISRVSVFAPVILCIYTVLLLIIVALINGYSDKISRKTFKVSYWVLISLITIAITILLIKIDPYSIHVDRWSAIHNLLQNLFNGIYPYSAKTHLGGYGSPFPIWQAFHIPFYLMGNVGFGMLFSVLLTAVLLARLFNSYKSALIFFVFLTLSPAFWYEVIVISDMFYNFLLCFLVITIIHKKKYSIEKQALGLGVLCGLFLSTRFSVVIPFAIFLLPSFIESDTKHKLLFAISAILMFVITFLPLVFWDFDTLFFFKYNPFILQTRQGSILEVVIISVLGIFLSTQWKTDFRRCSTFISVALCTLVLITFLHRMILDEFINGLFSGSYDITYFNMALPFIIFSMTQGAIIPENKNT